MNDRSALTITFTYMTTIVLVIAADAFIVGTALTHAFSEPSWVAALWILGLLGAAGRLQPARGADRRRPPGRRHLPRARRHPGRRGGGPGEEPPRAALPLSPLHGHSPASFIEAVALGVFLFSAFEWVTTSAEEVRTRPTSTAACSSPLVRCSSSPPWWPPR